METLADQQTCANIDSFRAAGIIPDPDTHLPLFYLACGGFYDSLGDQAGSYQMYTTFLSEYPQHPLATEAISALALDPQACQQNDGGADNEYSTRKASVYTSNPT